MSSASGVTRVSSTSSSQGSIGSSSSGKFYTPPAHPPVATPTTHLSEQEESNNKVALEPHPQTETLPTSHHYSQPILPPTQLTPTRPPPPLVPNYTAPIQPSENPRPPWGSELRPGNRSGSISPQLQHANVPGLGNVLIFDPSTGPYQIVTDVGDLYNMYATNAEEQGGGAMGGASPFAGRGRGLTNANVQQGRLTNAQANSPLLLIRANNQQPNTNRTSRSYSQPEANLQRYLPVGRGGGARRTWDCFDGGGVPEEEEGGAYPRRFSTPSRSNLEEQQQQPRVHYPMEEVTENVSQFGGYDYSFVSSREELKDFICPICQLVFCHPHITDCCGACFCHTCIRHHMSNHGYCPLCKNEKYHVFVDRKIERLVNSLRVKCPNNGDGCGWEGPLGQVGTHTDLNKGDCEHVGVHCPFCEMEMSLNHLYKHKVDCPRRPHSCKFCSFKGRYDDMPSHWPTCDGYPVPCPNECGRMDMPRRDLPTHLRECPRRLVECEFKFAGCHVTYPQADARLHEESSAHQHLFLMSKMVKDLATSREATPTAGPTHNELESRLEEKEKEIFQLKEQVQSQNEELQHLRSNFSVLQDSHDELKRDLQRVRSHVFTPPFPFTVHHFTDLRSSGKQWFSSPFYTHPQGYRMCISLDCNGSDEGSGTHVSVYANLMRGEFDDDLTWPFCGIIAMQLINQYGGGDKGGNIVHEIPFTRDVPVEISGRVFDQDLAESGLGVPQFVAHGQLAFDRYTNCGFIKNDCLRFCVTSIRRH